MSDSIKVVCRLRPLNKIQIAHDGQQCVSYGEKQISLAVGGEDTKYSFAFDRIFGPDTAQVSIYKQVSLPIIKVISGFNGTVFAYGQTGGGKTWTMEGPNHHDEQYRGLIPRTIQGLFSSISQSDENIEFVIKSSYVQIYNQKLFDLLDPSKARLEIKQDKHKGVFIQNCTQISVSTHEQMLRTMDTGSKNRKVAFTGMNQRSSRSHSLFIIHLYQKNTKKDSTKQSKLYFVDLAGSEKVGKTGVQGQQLQEAKNINKSLSALGNVINALTSDKKQHVPYRDSKLTRILQQSLGGNSKTTLIINCSMCTYNDKQTLSTLRFGYRAKSIKNKPKMNEQKSVKQLMVLLDAANKTITDLKSQLKLPLSSSSPTSITPLTQPSPQQDSIIQDLKLQLQQHKRQQQQRTNQMQTRIKQLLLQLQKQKDQKDLQQTKWSNIFAHLAEHLNKINKYVQRSYVDLDYCLNNILLDNQAIVQHSGKDTIENTMKVLEQYQEFYKKEVEVIMEEIIEGQKYHAENQMKINMLTPDKRNAKIALSEPALFNHNLSGQMQEGQNLQPNDNISCIIQNTKNQPSFEENSSDKISQSSFTEFQTVLQSLQTKQSNRIILEEMTNNMKELKKQNQQLVKKISKIMEERQNFMIKTQQKYQDKICQLQQRVHQYKNIMNQKDIHLTKNFQQIDKMKKTLSNQKVISQRLKKIIQSNGNMKAYYEMQERVRSLANQRQKIFNQLYALREQLDDNQISLKQKDQHIQSLKSVMKELNQSTNQMPFQTKEEINKSYNNQVYGTETPNIIQTVKGGGGKQQKISSLRKKTQGMVKKQENGKKQKQFVPFFKSFFS